MLHDLFALPFEDIAPVLERSTVATKKLASRARGRVRGASTVATADSGDRRALVEAFFAAARGGDLDALLALLAPEVVRRADRFAVSERGGAEVRGAWAVAERAIAARARRSDLALVDGEPGIVVAPLGRLFAVLRIQSDGGRITEIEIIADPTRLEKISLAVPTSSTG